VSSSNIKVSNTTTHVWPALRLGATAELAALIAELSRTQWLDATKVVAMQLAQARRLLESVGNRSPFYRDHAGGLLGELEAIRSMAEFRSLPPLTRADLQQAGDDFFCSDVPEDQGFVGEIRTSGSTGQPVRVRKTAINQLFWQANMMRLHDWHRIPYHSRGAVIRFGTKEYLERPHWGPPYAMLYRTGQVQFIPLSTTPEEQARLLRLFQPKMLQVMPSSLSGLADVWRAEGMGLPELAYIRTLGEILPDELRETVAELAPGVSVIDGYSSQEVGSIALQCPDGGGYHANAESLIVEVLDDDGEPCGPGETGRVVITDLHNLASPVVRYEIGDYAQVGEPCACGRGLPRLDRILGRSRNLVVLPNGDRYWPRLGVRRISGIVALRQLQVIQESLERVTVLLATEEPVTAEQKTAITAVVQDSLRHPFDVDIQDQREPLPAQPGGKLENFICRVST
jgi:phenylacetate-CoA ligase